MLCLLINRATHLLSAIHMNYVLLRRLLPHDYLTSGTSRDSLLQTTRDGSSVSAGSLIFMNAVLFLSRCPASPSKGPDTYGPNKLVVHACFQLISMLSYRQYLLRNLPLVFQLTKHLEKLVFGNTVFGPKADVFYPVSIYVCFLSSFPFL